jgi:hypothetical protein
MADSVSHTITLLSGQDTLTAGYTYDNPYFDSDAFASGVVTETAGYTTTDPITAPLNVASYSGSWSPAQVIDNPASPWVSIGGASWVSTTSLNSGVENPVENDTWRLFRTTFNITDISGVTGTSIQIAADNAYEFYFNGSLIDTTANWNPPAPVYGAGPGPGGTMIPFEQIATHTLTLQSGVNTMMFVVRNWDNAGSANPAGLIYKVTVQYAIVQQQLNPTVYSGAGSWMDAPAVSNLPSSWILGATGAQWVSTTADYSGTDSDYSGDAWRLFKDEFTIPDGTSINAATIQIAADNAYELYLNGSLVVSTASWSPTATVFGDSPEPGGTMVPFEHVAAYTLTPHIGTNTLMIVVRNWGYDDSSNPTGLMYTASVTYSTSSIPPTTPPGSVISVGGTVFQIDKTQLLLPWFGAGLGLLVILSFTVYGLFFRKRHYIPNR